MSRSDPLSPPNTAERIIAVSLGGLGDTILFSPVLKALRSRYPEAQIELLLASKLAKTALAPAGEIDRIIVANTNHLFPPAKAASLVPYALRSLFRGGFDLGVFATGLNPRLVFLLKNTALIRQVFRAQRPPAYETDLECNIALARVFESNVTEDDVLFPVTEEALDEVRVRLASFHIQETSRILAIYPSRDLPHRPRWQLWKLVGVIKRLRKSGFTGKAVVIGSEDEGREWHSADTHGIADANLAGKLSIRAAGALLSRCSLLVGNDGGIIHVAGAVGCPLVVLMTNVPISYRPPGKKTVVVKCSGPSRPWSQRKPLRPDEMERITESVTIDQVFQACMNMLRDE